MQFSSFSFFTGIIGKDCDSCDVDKKFDTHNKSAAGSLSSWGIKNMNAASLINEHQGGFKYTFL